MNALETILAKVKETDLALYRKAMEEMHVLAYGEHYTEDDAREAVAGMSSTDVSGVTNIGEHWTFEQTLAASQPYSVRMGAADTCWDVYVALNMWWHDLGNNYKRRGEPDEAIIEDAMTWSFFDGDAPEGKLWKYLHAMK